MRPGVENGSRGLDEMGGRDVLETRCGSALFCSFEEVRSAGLGSVVCGCP